MKKVFLVAFASLFFFSAHSQNEYVEYDVEILDGKTGEKSIVTGYLREYWGGYELAFYLKTERKNNTANTVRLYLYQENHLNYLSIAVNGKKRKWEHLHDRWIIITNYKEHWIRYDPKVGEIAFPHSSKTVNPTSLQ